MNRLLPLLIAAPAALIAACVTINVYFPAAAAQAAADRVIDEVWGGQGSPLPGPTPPPTPSDIPATPLSLLEPALLNAAGALLDFVMPAAHAQEEPNLDASSPEIKRLTDSMEARFPDLAPHYASGAVGISSDGFITVRDGNRVALPDRNKVRTLVANENADRSALYHEIAQANQQPQWEAQIRGVFAQRWIARAKTGWYVQDGANWKQK